MTVHEAKAALRVATMVRDVFLASLERWKEGFPKH
jgi:hypothetical protein